MSNKTLKLGFISSSDFCIPIGAVLLSWQGKTINQILSYKIELSGFVFTFENSYIPHDAFDLPIELCIIVSQPDSQNRSKTTPTPVSKWAIENKIYLWNPININQESNEVFDSLDLVVTASFGSIISQKLLDKPQFGYINWHPSLLPKYRGPTPMQSTILNRDLQYGLSWISMGKAMDTGKVLLQLSKNLEPNIDFLQMSKELGQLGSNTLIQAITNQILDIGNEQDQSQITFCSKIEKEKQLGEISSIEAVELMAQQKAYIYFPGTVFVDQYFGCRVKILECNMPKQTDTTQVKYYQNWAVLKEDKQQKVFLKCKNNTLLQVTKIQTENGKQIDLSGYQFVS